ncbi:oxidoreductase [Rhodococcus erythropolis]|uniref:flavin reductase family protein n=1 Tax=Rhodococcus erythropolis TaxID=1833 RepID=UPI000A066388|nr:flavin reductase family protein [Rhodococcus erythropolis]ORI30980.1 oxidoreductase [Rhodococcus erythropolis]
MISSRSTLVDETTMRAVHGTFVTGVTVVTTLSNSAPRGLALNAFTSISLSPPLVMVCVQRSSKTHDLLFNASHLAINILAAEQLSTAAMFASKNDDKFASIAWHSASHGSPILDGACSWMEAEICDRLQVETHTAFVAQVVEANHSDRAPLLYRAGNFFDGSQLRPATQI